MNKRINIQPDSEIARFKFYLQKKINKTNRNVLDFGFECAIFISFNTSFLGDAFIHVVFDV